MSVFLISKSAKPLQKQGPRKVGYWGGPFHIIGFTHHKNNQFHKKLMRQKLSIWIWTPSITDFRRSLKNSVGELFHSCSLPPFFFLGNRGLVMPYDEKSHCHLVQTVLSDWTIRIWGIILLIMTWERTTASDFLLILYPKPAILCGRNRLALGKYRGEAAFVTGCLIIRLNYSFSLNKNNSLFT